MFVSATLTRLRLGLGALFVLLMVLLVQPAGAASPNLVISQVYGGGGNAGAPYSNDYIEIFNRGSTTVSTAGWSLQYTSATGTGNFGSSATLITELPSISVAPGQYVLVEEAAGATSSVPLPTPDVTDATPINMSATAGKVALVGDQTSLGCNGGSTPCDASQLVRIVDLVGYGGANFFEGSGPTGSLSNTTAALRNGGGCMETDNNASDFSVAAPLPRNTASPTATCGDNAPAVASTNPMNGAIGVPVGSNVTIDFTEVVDVTGSWYSISCASSGAHTATASGGPQSFTLDPDSDFAQGELCTVTVAAGQVTDQDAADPPDTMAADHVFSFTTFAPPPEIAEIQGAAHISPKNGQGVADVEGIVTALRTAGGRGFWIQDPTPDDDDATSDAIFVFVNAAPVAQVGDVVQVDGTVTEFRAGGDPDNLTYTEIVTSNASVTILSSGNAVPAPTVLGPAGRTPPTEVIDDDGAGNVETGGTFDPTDDAIDFYESLEGMLLQVNDGVLVNATRSFGEITLLPDLGSWATGLRSPRGGILLGGYTDLNPERIIVDDEILRDLAPLPRPVKAMPDMNVGDSLTSPVVGPLDYSFSNYKIQALTTPTFVSSGLQREIAGTAQNKEVSVATFNVENLAGTDPQAKYDHLASLIVTNLRSPDILAIEEVQDNDGVSGGTASTVVDASTSWTRLIAAIQAAGGPDIPVPADRSGRRPGRWRSGREHPGRFPLPYRYRRDVRRSAGRLADDRDDGDGPEAARAAALGEPGPPRNREPVVRRHAEVARRRVQDQEPAVLRDREPLQLEGRRPAALRAEPTVVEAQRDRPARAGSGGKRLRRRDPGPRPERTGHRAGRHQRLRVLGDSRHPRGRAYSQTSSGRSRRTSAIRTCSRATHRSSTRSSSRAGG